MEKQNEEYIEMQKKLKELIGQAEKLIQQHKEAGCVLPDELENWKPQTSHSLSSEPVAMEQSPSNSCFSSRPSPATTAAAAAAGEQSSSAQPPQQVASPSGLVDEDPMALFSGESLSPIAPSPQRHQNRVRPYSVSPPAKQAIIRKEGHKNSQLLLAQFPQTHRRSTPHVSHGQSQVTQEVQSIPDATHQNQQSQSSITFRAVSSSSLQTSLSQVQHGTEQPVKTSIIQVNGSAFKVIWRNNAAQFLVTEKSNALSGQTIDTAKRDSSINHEAQSPMTSEVYEEQRVPDTNQTAILTGNLPAAELLGNFDQAAQELGTPGTNENANCNYNGLISDSWNGGETNYDFFSTTTEPTFPQQESVGLEGYSYTHDLNLSETPQHILHQIQTQNFQQQNRENVQAFRTLANAEPQAFSACGAKPTAATPSCSQVREPGSVAPGTPLLGPKEGKGDRTERASTGVKTSVACAPAILDMLSESEVSQSVQVEIKESLGLPGPL